MGSADAGPDPSGTDQEVLQGDEHRVVVRIGAAVHRPQHPWSPSVHALLDRLRSLGFTPAPHFLGVDAEGRERLTYLPGSSGPDGWAEVVPEAGLVAMAKLLRRYHDAIAGWDVDGSAGWAAHLDPCRPGEIVCHGDFGPWNLVWVDHEPVGVLDWDYAWPRPPLFDLAYALEYVAPFRDDQECLRWLRYPAPPDRRRRLAVFAEAYGFRGPGHSIDDHDIGVLHAAVVDQQRAVLDRMITLARAGLEPQQTWVTGGAVEVAEAHIRWSGENRGLFGLAPVP